MVRVTSSLVVNSITTRISSLRNRLRILTVFSQRVNNSAVICLTGCHEVLCRSGVRRIQSFRGFLHRCGNRADRERLHHRTGVVAHTRNRRRGGIHTDIDITGIGHFVVRILYQDGVTVSHRYGWSQGLTSIGLSGNVANHSCRQRLGNNRERYCLRLLRREALVLRRQCHRSRAGIRIVAVGYAILILSNSLAVERHRHGGLDFSSIERLVCNSTYRHCRQVGFANRKLTRCRARIFALTFNGHFCLITYIDVVGIATHRIVSTRQRRASKHDRGNSRLLLLTVVDDASIGINHRDGSALNARAALERSSHLHIQVLVRRQIKIVGGFAGHIGITLTVRYRQLRTLIHRDSFLGCLYRTAVQRSHCLDVVFRQPVAVSRLAGQFHRTTIHYFIRYRTTILGSNGNLHFLFCPCRNGCQHQQGHCG